MKMPEIVRRSLAKQEEEIRNTLTKKRKRVKELEAQLDTEGVELEKMEAAFNRFAKWLETQGV